MGPKLQEGTWLDGSRRDHRNDQEDVIAIWTAALTYTPLDTLL